MSNYLHQLNVGDRVRAYPPFGPPTLSPRTLSVSQPADQADDTELAGPEGRGHGAAVFVSTGSGITPMVDIYIYLYRAFYIFPLPRFYLSHAC